MIVDTKINESLWLIEIYSPGLGWRVDTIKRLEKYAAAHLAAMQAVMDGQRLRMRRFVEEGKTPRGGKVRKVRG